MEAPLVSVLLPVYNGVPYLGEAIESILRQTYQRFELIIVNDGSTDDSAAIIASFDDQRIKYFEQENLGLTATLNRAITLSSGGYIARQDADDVSFPERLAKQVAFLERHPDHGMVGSWSEIWEGSRRTKRAHQHPCDNIALKFHLLFGCYFVHTSVMLRSSVLQRVGLYATERSRQPEDYELWSRILRSGCCKVANLPEKLVAYREVPDSICRSDFTLKDGVVNICRENLAMASRRGPDEQVVNDLAALAHYAFHRLSHPPRMMAVSSLIGEVYSWAVGDEPGQVSLLKELWREQARIWRAYLSYRLRPLAAKLGLLPSGKAS